MEILCLQIQGVSVRKQSGQSLNDGQSAFFFDADMDRLILFISFFLCCELVCLLSEKMPQKHCVVN